MELKFRALNKNNKWDYGVTSLMEIPDIANNDYLFIGGLLEDYYNGCYIDGTLGQYTGLKDINGKEVYKDDIVSVKNGVSIYPIAWDCGKGSWELKKVFSHMSPPWYTRETNTIKEVIGNIHENGDLLND